MSMQGSTLRILEAANFTSVQALALAEAIEGEIKGAELVTVPIMDSRFAAVDARFSKGEAQMAKMETRLTNKMMALFGIGLAGIVIEVILALAKK